MSDMTRTNTEPSVEALEAAAAVLPITWGKQLVRDVALALDRFRANGVREERERIAAWIEDHAPETSGPEYGMADEHQRKARRENKGNYIFDSPHQNSYISGRE